MLSKDKLLKISKFLFLTLVFLIPLNLGKHFEIIDSYVWGILIDYLVPTVFIQDILVFIIISFWFLGDGIKKIFNSEFLSKKEVQLSTLLVFSLLLSVFVSNRFVPSIYGWLRFFIYYLLFLYVLIEIPVEEYFFKILNVLSISVFLVGVLGIAQYLNKGSVFNNYLVLGEQPYSSVVYGITKETFFGRNIIPAYGLFRHPNIFAGYLALVLIWLFSFLKKHKFYIFAFVAGLVSLILTFSFISLLVFILGIVLHIYFSKNPKRIKFKKKTTTVLVLLFCIFICLVPLSKIFSEVKYPSIVRRINFSRASYRMIKDYSIFGVGFNNSTILMDECNYETKDLRFTQPVHNIFLLIFSEAGIFSIVLFVSFLYISGKRLINSSYFHLFLISFLQILVLGSFDHYFLTIHQTLLLFWIFFGLALQ